MGFENSNTAKEFIDFIKSMIEDSNRKNTFIIPSIVSTENSDGTFNVYIPPDLSTEISGIRNGSIFEIKPGDTVFIIAVNGDISNSFIIYKQGGKDLKKYIEEYLVETVSEIEDKTVEDKSVSIDDITDIGKLYDMIYPIGSVYIQTNDIEPAERFGGVWEKIEGRFLLGSGTTSGTQKTYINGSKDGSADAVVVQHKHRFENGTNDSFIDTSPSPGAWDSKYISIASPGYYMGTSDYGNALVGRLNQIITDTGVPGDNKNMPPYQVVNIWERTE